MDQYLNWLQTKIQNRQPTQIEMMNRNLNEIAISKPTAVNFGGSGLPNQKLIDAAAKITAKNKQKEEDKNKQPKSLDEGEERFLRLARATNKAADNAGMHDDTVDLLAGQMGTATPDARVNNAMLIARGPLGDKNRALWRRESRTRDALHTAANKYARSIAGRSGVNITTHTDHFGSRTVPPSFNKIPSQPDRVLSSILPYSDGERSPHSISAFGDIPAHGYNPILHRGGAHATSTAAQMMRSGRSDAEIANQLSNVPRRGVRRILAGLRRQQSAPRGQQSAPNS